MILADLSVAASQQQRYSNENKDQCDLDSVEKSHVK